MMNTAQPLVSVIVISYKTERFLGEALRSVSAQTYTNWEVIVVEDSEVSDGADLRARQFQESVPQRVQYIRHSSNLGIPSARNSGVKASRGEWIAFLDADDLWETTHLEGALKALEESKAQLAFSSPQNVTISGKYTTRYSGEEAKEKMRDLPKALFAKNFIQATTVVMDRDVVSKVGLFDAQFPYCDDLEYWMRCALRGIRFVHVDGVQCFYRRHAESATVKSRSRVLENQARFQRKYFWQKSIPFLIRIREMGRVHALTGRVLAANHEWQGIAYLLFGLLLWPFEVSNVKELIRAFRHLLKSLIPMRVLTHK